MIRNYWISSLNTHSHQLLVSSWWQSKCTKNYRFEYHLKKYSGGKASAHHALSWWICCQSVKSLVGTCMMHVSTQLLENQPTHVTTHQTFLAQSACLPNCVYFACSNFIFLIGYQSSHDLLDWFLQFCHKLQISDWLSWIWPYFSDC